MKAHISTQSAPETESFLCYEIGDSWVNVASYGGRIYIDSCNCSGDISLSPRQAKRFANKILAMIAE